MGPMVPENILCWQKEKRGKERKGGKKEKKGKERKKKKDRKRIERKKRVTAPITILFRDRY
jgi:hypothetical protein